MPSGATDASFAYLNDHVPPSNVSWSFVFGGGVVVAICASPLYGEPPSLRHPVTTGVQPVAVALFDTFTIRQLCGASVSEIT